MDLSKLKTYINTYFQKYKYIILILCVGIVLILWPSRSKEDINRSETTDMMESAHISEESLAAMLSSVDGAGRVEVLLSLEYSEQTDYQTDRDNSSANNERTNTVITTDSQRNEIGLIKKICAPVYRGAIIVCDGANDPAVELSVISAVSNLTGLRSDQISVLKMK